MPVISNVSPHMSRLLAIVGLVATVGYLLSLYLLIGDRVFTLLTLPLNELGDFLAGVFGPIAILWLILGFFQQGIELRQNTDALSLQAKELQNSVEQQRQLVEVSRQQVSAELEVIKFERERTAMAARPHFVCEGVGHMVSGNKGKYSLTLKNVGNTATLVFLTFDPPMRVVSPKEVPSWSPGEVKTCSFEYVTDLAEGESKFDIRFTDAMGIHGVQSFMLVAVATSPHPSISIRPCGG
jgi:hypothetical protein